MTKEKPFVEKIVNSFGDNPSPMLLKFQNGGLKAVKKNNTIFVPIKYKSAKTTGAAVIASGNIYHGVMSEGFFTHMMDSYICVRNKTSNKVRIVPISYVDLLNDVYKEKEKTKFSRLSKENSLGLLVKNFGGRKASRYFTNMEKMQMNVDVVKNQLETTVNESNNLKPLEANAVFDENSRIRPPFKKDAAKLDEIYNLIDIIPDELLGRLDEESHLVYSTDIADIPISSQYLLQNLNAIQKAVKSSQRFLNVKVIIYMDALLNLIKTRSTNLKKVELSRITEKVENDVRNRFSEPTTSNLRRTTYTNEKALCYFLVLALLISDDYQVDINVIAQELCMSKQKILKFSNIIHAKLKPRTDLLTLRLPSTIKPLGTKVSKYR